MAYNWAYASIIGPDPYDPEWPTPGTSIYDPPWPWPEPPYATSQFPSPNPYPSSVTTDKDNDTYRFTHIVKSLNQRLVDVGESVSSLSTTQPDRRVTIAKINLARNYIEGLYDKYVKSTGALYTKYNDILEDAHTADTRMFGSKQTEGGWTWTSLNTDKKTIDIKADMEATDIITPHLFYELELALAQLIYTQEVRDTLSINSVTNGRFDGTGFTQALAAGTYTVTYTSGATRTASDAYWNLTSTNASAYTGVSPTNWTQAISSDENTWTQMPGFSASSTWATAFDAQTANAGTSISFVHTGATLYYVHIDDTVGDNEGTVVYTITSPTVENTYAEDVNLAKWTATDAL